MDDLDRFVLTDDLPDHGLSAGDLGTIVMVHQPGDDYTGPDGYTAEFTYLTGETRAVVDLRPNQVRPAEDGEVVRATKAVGAVERVSCFVQPVAPHVHRALTEQERRRT